MSPDEEAAQFEELGAGVPEEAVPEEATNLPAPSFSEQGKAPVHASTLR